MMNLPHLQMPQDSERVQGVEDAPWTVVSLSASSEIIPLLDRLGDEMLAKGYTSKEMFGVRLALEEALVNAIKHGHRYDPSKRVSLRYQLNTRHMLAEIRDQGPGFCPEAVPDPLSPENWERSTGRGLLLMRNYMSWVRFNENGTCVTLCKLRAG